jgi:hypothetical protein
MSNFSKIEERLERIAPDERSMLPSELLAQKQLFSQCGEENTTERDVELLGDDCLLWGLGLSPRSDANRSQSTGQGIFRAQRSTVCCEEQNRPRQSKAVLRSVNDFAFAVSRSEF